jgi:hypothetical protein
VLKDRLRQAAGNQVWNAFVLDPKGVIRAATEPIRPVIGIAFPGRDYFVGACDRADKRGLDRVHVARFYTSENDTRDKLAVSAAFLPQPEARPWVLVWTVTTGATIGQNDVPTDELKAVLVAPIDTQPPRPGAAGEQAGYVIMAHPAFDQGEKSVRYPSGRPVPVGQRTVHESELGPPPSHAPFPQDVHYQDPVGTIDPEFRGRWLAGSACVGNTELVVLVQQRYDQAVTPYQRGFGRFLTWVCGSVVAGLLLFASLRVLRRRQAKSSVRSEI